jgi:hypothetical protein
MESVKAPGYEDIYKEQCKHYDFVTNYNYEEKFLTEKFIECANKLTSVDDIIYLYHPHNRKMTNTYAKIIIQPDQSPEEKYSSCHKDKLFNEIVHKITDNNHEWDALFTEKGVKFFLKRSYNYPTSVYKDKTFMDL